MDAAWSPDGETVAFTSFENMTYALWTMPWRDEPVAEAEVERPEPGEYGYREWLARRGHPGPGAEGADPSLPVEEEAAVLREGAPAAGVAPPVAGEEEANPGEAGEAETAEEGEAEPPTVRELGVTDTAEESREYGLKFTPDYLTTSFAYTSGGVLQNYTVFGLSDILGGHHIDVLFDLTSIGSYNDVDLALDYYYLTRRTSYIFSGITWQDYYIARDIAFDQRVSGGSVLAVYPLNARNRLEVGVYGYDRRRKYFYNPEETFIPGRGDNMVGGVGSFVRDTSQWGYYHPTAGTRLRYTVRQTAPVAESSLFYTEQLLDARRYIRLSNRVSLAFRLVGGLGTGEDPQPYFLGGGATLRGYGYSALYGSRFGLGNFEFRFPLLDVLVWPIEGFAIGGFRGVFFADLGTAWSDYDETSPYPEDHQWYIDKEDQKYDEFTFATSEGGWHLVHGKMAFGTGIRWWLGYFDIKLDWGWRTNLRGVETPARFHFTLGYDY
jgi:hypothetical protein